jgi:tRNA(adenine34) deaminase
MRGDIFLRDDNFFMKMAYDQALKAFKFQEVPIGAVLVDQKGNVVTRSYNQVEKFQTQTAHAEISLIKKAAKKIKNWRLEGMTLYVTVQPCMMCLGAIYLSRISKVVYGVASPKYGFDFANNAQLGIYKNLHTFTQCIDYTPAQKLLQKFFEKKRKRSKNEQIRARKNKAGSFTKKA